MSGNPRAGWRLSVRVGDLVRSRYAVGRIARARIGIVMQLREGAYVDQPLAQVCWTRKGVTGWVEAKDMEIVNESR